MICARVFAKKFFLLVLYSKVPLCEGQNWIFWSVFGYFGLPKPLAIFIARQNRRFLRATEEKSQEQADKEPTTKLYRVLYNNIYLSPVI